jgi:hypothetical protein
MSDAMKVPPINLWTYRQAYAVALWLALGQLTDAPAKPEQAGLFEGAA